MDHLPHFRREVAAFEAAVRPFSAVDEALIVPSCTGWSVADLVMHLGLVHRYVIRIVGHRLSQPPDISDVTIYQLPPDAEGWPNPEHAPHRGPMPAGLIAWFAGGAAALATLFAGNDPDQPVWTWSRAQNVGFWLRMQTIEAAVHRWDAENVTGAARPMDPGLAADAVAQTFTVMAPFRRILTQAPPGSGERFRLSQTDGPGTWTVCFDGDDVRFTTAGGPGDVELAGTASDLMLFLWHRIPADQLKVSGERQVLDRYFTLVPPV